MLKETGVDGILRSNRSALVHFSEYKIPIQHNAGSRDSVMFIFHGASDRTRMAYPRFPGVFTNMPDLTQIAVSDASLEVSEELASAWYSGSESFPAQEIYPKLFEKISSKLGAKRRIYLGGSSGGFAALYYSWLDKGSVAIVGNPQTNLNNYRLNREGKSRALNNYRSLAWPDVPSNKHLGQMIDLDVGSCYAKSFDNTVIYLQSAGDRTHMAGQMTDFLSKVGDNLSRFVLDVGFHGVLGHSNSVPYPAYRPWVQTALASPTLEADDLLVTHHILKQKNPTQNNLQMPSKSGPSGFSETDQSMANLLRDYQLRNVRSN